MTANHLVIVGPTGTGKSWLACALGNKACRDGFSVLYKRASRLFADLAQARGEGRLARLIAALERVNLLILDDWGPEPLTADQRRDLLEIVDDRYDKGSLLITSQVPVSQWHDVIADPTLGDAILDRIADRFFRMLITTSLSGVLRRPIEFTGGLAEPVVTAACFFCCRRAMGAACTRHSLCPLFSEGQN